MDREKGDSACSHTFSDGTSIKGTFQAGGGLFPKWGDAGREWSPLKWPRREDQKRQGKK